MTTKYSLLILLVAAATGTHAQVFRAQADARVEACADVQIDTSGGSGEGTSQLRLTGRASCSDESVVSASAYSDLASGYAYVAASAQGAPDENRATSTAQYTDLVGIESTGDIVQVRATLSLIAAADGNAPGGSEFLFARITLGQAGEIELRGCNPSFCPDEPVETATLSGEYTLLRNANGQFPPIGVAATAIVDARNGGGFYSARTSVEVIDDSGAQITSASGIYGSALIDDGDADGAPDTIDTCRTRANPDQRDSDGDGAGNACDADLNNDQIVNMEDLGLLRQRFFSNDPDADLNGDGVVNVVDLGRFRLLFGSAPGAPD